MEKIKRFIESVIPVTACNIKCSYCYVVQRNDRTNQLPDFQYNAEHIGQALSKQRLGGTCYINICGLGETLIPKEMTRIIECILKQGHYINITTNGTISERIDEIVLLPKELASRLHFAFSFHYLELKRVKMIDAFFANINKVKNAGCSFLVQVNLCDEYLPYLDEIASICMKNVGAAPQLAVTRNETTKPITLMTKYSTEEYRRFGDKYKSPLFNYSLSNFMKKRKEFCYAGDWSAILDLSNGVMKKCYCEYSKQNIFEDLNKPIKFEALGNNCPSPYCSNSTHFMSLGIIPELSTPSYASLRDRQQAEWYSPQMREFLSGKLIDSNVEYGRIKKALSNIAGFFDWNVKHQVHRIKAFLMSAAKFIIKQV